MQDVFSYELKSISDIIQLSIAPVFMLAGIAGFLTVFTNRLARVIDRLEKISLYKVNAKHKLSEKRSNYLQKREKTLKKRMKNINQAILFMTFTGLLVALLMISMFLGILFDFHDGFLISLFFISSMLSFIYSLFKFLLEILHTVSIAEVSEDYKELDK